jgi:hypothetical protein
MRKLCPTQATRAVTDRPSKSAAAPITKRPWVCTPASRRFWRDPPHFDRTTSGAHGHRQATSVSKDRREWRKWVIRRQRVQTMKWHERRGGHCRKRHWRPATCASPASAGSGRGLSQPDRRPVRRLGAGRLRPSPWRGPADRRAAGCHSRFWTAGPAACHHAR